MNCFFLCCFVCSVRVVAAARAALGRCAGLRHPRCVFVLLLRVDQRSKQQQDEHPRHRRPDAAAAGVCACVCVCACVRSCARARVVGWGSGSSLIDPPLHHAFYQSIVHLCFVISPTQSSSLLFFSFTFFIILFANTTLVVVVHARHHAFIIHSLMMACSFVRSSPRCSRIWWATP